MSEEKLLDHDADGIKELDNPLPSWWLYLFYVSIIWSFYYYVATMFIGTTPAERAQAAMAKLNSTEKSVEVMLAEGDYTDFSNDPDILAQGQSVYKTNCASCHGVDGGGLVGPNMADNYWIHGAEFADMYRVVIEGVPDKGMISWKPILKDSEIRAVISYLKTFAGTTPSKPKAPEGVLIE